MPDKILQAIEGLKSDFTNKFDSLTDKIDTLSEKVDNQGKQIDTILEKVDNHGKQIDTLLEKADKHEKQIDTLLVKVDNQGIQIRENTQLLKALEHLAQVNKAEHDKMSYNIAEITGEIKAIRKDLLNVELITASNWGDIVKLKTVK